MSVRRNPTKSPNSKCSLFVILGFELTLCSSDSNDDDEEVDEEEEEEDDEEES